jgi:protein TonB
MVSSLLAELMLVAIPSVGDTIPPPPPPPPPHVEEVSCGSYREQMPIAPGCETEADYSDQYKCTQETMVAFIKDNLRWPSPEWCGQGTAVISFTIEKDGRVSSPFIARSISGLGVDEECRRMLELIEQKFPTWTPGKQAGRAVAVRYNLPLKFKLE